MPRSAQEFSRFRRTVWTHYRTYGRHDLPWRKTTDPYRILVSEIMLQQTQVDRVVPFYTAFIKRFPTAKKLSAAPLGEVLKSWQGLGYNRRAKMLHQAAKNLVAHGMPRTAAELERLPGVGPYTARAVAAFAWNEDGIVIETNIRTAIIHHFPLRPDTTIYGSVRDVEIAAILEKVLPKGKACEWYSALMDYGAHLKRSGVSHNARMKGYVKQSRFIGSLREVRGIILRELASAQERKAIPKARLRSLLGTEREEQLKQALDALLKEGFIVRNRYGYSLA